MQPGQTVRAFVSQDGSRRRLPSSGSGAPSSGSPSLSELVLGESTERVGGHAVLPDGTAVFVPLGDAIDVGRECGRLGAETERLAALVSSQEKKLGNEQFVSRAPAEVVAREREKLATWSEQREVLVRKRELLGCVMSGRTERRARVVSVLSALGRPASLRPHRAPARRSARHHPAAAHRDPAGFVRRAFPGSVAAWSSASTR